MSYIPKHPVTRCGAALCLPFVLSISVFGCRGEPRSSGPAISDSAGVTILENATPSTAEGPGWRLAAEPSLDIGAGEGAYQLHQVAGALKLGDGRIVVANGSSAELRFFDADGRFLASAGRKGGGPGEFKALMWIRQTVGDSLLAYDWRNRRVSVFDDWGNFARSFQPQILDQGGFPVHAGVFPDGTLLLAADMTPTRDRFEGTHRDSILFYRCASDGSVIDTLGTFLGGESFAKQQGENWLSGGLVFGKSGHAAVSGDGFFYGSADRYQIEFIGADGRLRRVIRVEQPNLEVRKQDIEAYVAERIASARNERRRQIYEAMFKSMPFPDVMPAYGRFIVDAEGHLWVADYLRPGDDQPRWKVFDRNGGLLGTVATPPRLKIYEIGSDYVLGRWSDALDIEHVRVYRLQKD